MAYEASYPEPAAPAGDDEEGAEPMDEKPEGESPGDGQDQGDPGDNDEEDSGEESALIPKSLLAGKDFEPGEEIVFQIVKMRGDEVEIRYAKEKPDDSEMSKADGKLAKMGGY